MSEQVQASCYSQGESRHVQVQLRQAEDDVFWRVVGRGKGAQAGMILHMQDLPCLSALDSA
jgi:hypothetical protein